jgi:hypothetical protein
MKEYKTNWYISFDYKVLLIRVILSKSTTLFSNVINCVPYLPD